MAKVPATKTEFEIEEIKDRIDKDIATMGGALDTYDLTYDFIADRLMKAFEDPALSYAEERKRLDMILKIRGGYSKETKESKAEFIYRWDTGDDNLPPDKVIKKMSQKRKSK